MKSVSYLIFVLVVIFTISSCKTPSDKEFNQDISMWKINPKCNTKNMFVNCYIEDKYKPKCLQ